MRIVGVIQARMGSSRLPGKVLRPLAGRTALGRLVRAVQESGAVDDVVVATTAEEIDDPVADEADRLGVPVHRGATDDVLSRFLGALDAHPGDAVMRFTADCPLLDPEIAALGAQVFRSVPGLDYLTHRRWPVRCRAAWTSRSSGRPRSGRWTGSPPTTTART